MLLFNGDIFGIVDKTPKLLKFLNIISRPVNNVPAGKVISIILVPLHIIQLSEFSTAYYAIIVLGAPLDKEVTDTEFVFVFVIVLFEFINQNPDALSIV